jgi:D-2-hydroxyacid dehydrogenase (NADP+)
MALRLGIHDSVEAVFPPEVLQAELDDLDAAVSIVGGSDVDGLDALVTFAHDDAFLDVQKTTESSSAAHQNPAGSEDADLRWVHSVQAGVDKFPLGEYENRGISVTNSTGLHGASVGETVAGYMLSFARRLHEYRSNQERGEWAWADREDTFTVTGSSVSVVGRGTLGKGIAARADALGMDVTGVKRTPTPVDHVDHVHPNGELHEAIAGAKFVALAVPLTDETEGMIGEEELSVMRDDAVLVNVARGPVVDQDALVDALQNDDLAGAALDVFEEEPLPEDSPLWDVDDVIVTPHAAAATRDYPENIAALVRENARRLEAGESLGNLVV